MRGLDLLGSLVTVHRSSLHSPLKVILPFLTWSLSAATVNAWRLKEFVKKAINPEEYQQEPYISFLRELFQSMLETHSSRQRHTNIAKKVCTESRLYGKEHFPVAIESADGLKIRQGTRLSAAKSGNCAEGLTKSHMDVHKVPCSLAHRVACTAF